MKEPKVFDLGYSGRESWSSNLFFHDSKTREEFDADVRMLLRKYGEEYLKQEESWVGGGSWIEYVVTKLPELGYREIDTIRVSFDECMIIKEDDADSDFVQAIGPELFKAAVRQNEELEAKTYSE